MPYLGFGRETFSLDFDMKFENCSMDIFYGEPLIKIDFSNDFRPPQDVTPAILRSFDDYLNAQTAMEVDCLHGGQENWWNFDLALAAAHFGHTRPVRVAPTEDPSLLGGLALSTHPLGTEGIHTILLNVRMPPGWASVILWHELTHCAQAEAHPTLRAYTEATHDEYAGSQRLDPIEYMNLPSEAPAFRNARLHFDVGPLCRPAVDLRPSETLAWVPGAPKPQKRFMRAGNRLAPAAHS